MDLAGTSFDQRSLSRSRKRVRFLEYDGAHVCFVRVFARARALRQSSDDHVTVASTMVEARAFLMSFRREDAGRGEPDNLMVEFHCERGSNIIRESGADRETEPAQKRVGQGKKSYCFADAQMDNRDGIPIDLAVEKAEARTDQRSARQLIARSPGRTRSASIAAPTAASSSRPIAHLRSRPESRAIMSAPAAPRSIVSTARHGRYMLSPCVREWVGKMLDWMKAIARIRPPHHCGFDRTQVHADLVASA